MRVFSFSFHQAGPEDETGNGRGVVFDARNLPNPGRGERPTHLTGKDADVAQLDRDDAVRQHLAHATSLVDPRIRTDCERDFMDLTVSFRCSDGRLRSVYLAEALARRLKEGTGITVPVRHLGLEARR